MPSPYRLLYQVGFTPWDGKTDIAPILDLLEGMPPGQALDLGCGTGEHVLAMAERGWQVTGVDGVPKALRAARRRAESAGAAGARVRFVKGDVTRLGDVLTSQHFDLVTDVGCFHGLTDNQRTACLAALRPFTAIGTHLVMLAVVPRRGIGPSGLDEAALRRHAGTDWTVDDIVDIDPVNTKSPLGDAPFRWYHLRRTG